MDAVLDNTQATVTAPVIGSTSAAAQDTITQTVDANSVSLATTTLQDVVARAAKGSSMENLIPLSCLMSVKIEDKKITIRTTDNVNFLTSVIDIPSTGKNIEFVVDSKLFATIISKLTRSITTLTIKDGNVVIEADGKYTVSIAVDQSTGTTIEFPVKTITASSSTIQLTGDEVSSILSYNRVCKKDTKDMPELYNYYFNENCACTTDTFKACMNTVKLTDRPIMLSSKLVELIPSVVDESGVSVCQNDEMIHFFSSKGDLIGKKQSNTELDKFPILDMQEAFEIKPAYKIALNTSLFYQALERISLFVDPSEKYKMTVRFTPTGVDLVSEKTQSNESMVYVKYDKAVLPQETLTFEFDVTYLKNVISAVASETLVVSFEKDSSLYFEGNTVRMIVSEIGEESYEEM